MKTVDYKKGKWDIYIWVLILSVLWVFTVCSGCSTPSAGWFERIENSVNQEKEALMKIEVHTNALANTIKDEAIQEERKKLLNAIPKPEKAPSDESPFSDWTWILVLAGVSAFSPAVANKLQDIRGKKS